MSSTAVAQPTGMAASVAAAAPVLHPDLITTKDQNQSQRYSDIIKQLQVRDVDGDPKGGVVIEVPAHPTAEHKCTLHFGNPHDPSKGVVSLKTSITPEQALQLRDDTVWTREFSEMMMAIAKSYQSKTMLILEGDPSIGKTFAVERFTEFLYGPGTKPEDFYCHRQTDASELLGRWVPVVADQAAQDRLKRLLSSPEYAEKLKELNGDPQAIERFDAVFKKLAVEIGIDANTRWTYEFGALPRAMLLKTDADGRRTVDDKNPGPGFILHVEEIGHASPGVVNAILALGGEHGKIADSIQLHNDSGREIPRGKNFWLVMSTNPCDENGFQDRKPLDKALISRSKHWKQTEPVDLSSTLMYARKLFKHAITHSVEGQTPNCKLPFSNHPEVVKEISETAGQIHHAMLQMFSKGERGGRRQTIAVNTRDLARLATYCLHFQKDSPDGKSVDLAATLKSAVADIYLSRVADRTLRREAQAQINEILDGVTGQKNFRGAVQQRSEILRELSREASASDPTVAKLIAREKKLEVELLKRRPDKTPRGGLMAEEILAPDGKKSTVVHIANPWSKDTNVITIPTRLSVKDVEKLRDEIVWTPAFSELFSVAAKAYQTRSLLILEGDTSVGKTFSIDKLSAIVFGKDQNGQSIKPENLYCNEMTGSDEFVGKWVPSIPNGHNTVQKILSSKWGQRQLAEIEREVTEMGDLSEKDRAQIVKMRIKDLTRGLAAEGESEWRFQPGAIERAMTMDRNEANQKVLGRSGVSPGCFFHVQEAGLARPGVVNSMLPIGGLHGRVAKQIQNYASGGNTIKAGEEFWAVISTNPPEGRGFQKRNELDAALVARGVFYRADSKTSSISNRMLAQRIFSFSIGNLPEERSENCHLEYYKYPELTKEIGELMGRFHSRCISLLNAEARKKGTALPIPDNRYLGKAAQSLLSFQILDDTRSKVDMLASLAVVVEEVYGAGLGKRSDLKDKIKDLFNQELAVTTGDPSIPEKRGDRIARLARDLDLTPVANEVTLNTNQTEKINGEIDATRNQFDEMLRRLGLGSGTAS